MKKILEKVFALENLDLTEARRAMDLILDGDATPEQSAAFLGALQAKTETAVELLGFLQALRARGRQVKISRKDAVDVCGTGGDASGSFNISTATAFVVAGAGAAVAKHGNRSVSSRCGSADVLEALGLKIDLPPDVTIKALDDIGFGFFFAPDYHPVLAKVAGLRKAIGVRTVFNLLGPLANPALVTRQLIGVYDSSKIGLFAEVLMASGTEQAMIVSSEDGLDEFSLKSKTKVARLKENKISNLILAPEDFGIKTQADSDLKGGDATQNAAMILRILEGDKGAKRDVVVLNAAAALMVAGKAGNFLDGVQMACQSIDSGKAKQVVEKMRLVR